MQMEVHRHVFKEEIIEEKSSLPKFFVQLGDQLPRKRGRPRKHDISLKGQIQIVQKAPGSLPGQLVPRKRGRPRKVSLGTPVIPRTGPGPGRPRKLPLLNYPVIPRIGRGPGRPRKLPVPPPREDSNDGLSDISQILANCASYTELELPPSLFN
nr:PREDICTED: uncharacterized protein LOC109031829 isoform X1 [Bemisia tabaci]